MTKLKLALALALVFGVLSCGKSGSTGSLKSGFYVVDGDTSKVHYPLVVLKVGGGKTSLYQVSQIISGGFGSGSSVTSDSEDYIGTLGTSVAGSKTTYAGIVTKTGSDLRMRAYKTNSFVSSPDDLATKAEVLQDYTLKSVPKDKAIASLRTMVTPRAAGTVYSDSQEEACRGAFEMSCNELVPAP